jgi:hypothetical protein
MICLGIMAFLDVEGSVILVVLLLSGGAWYLYKGFRQRA